ncbi:Cytochrome c oxidase polypeptide 5 mitochondrial [Ceratocystis lukuohia]|uniref:Cytochrome c oxidase polypeptide V n=3 Tax=Ceratocystis TaxID=5157 RepID=A0A0F8CQT6_CERFI|nr:Cytochrome c oxidase polypeptide 5 mitochondrial [Ceratocystis platani]PHH50621.1 Cytochrome c oxidase polypeptide 5, mitochondrial [Ceratocystis fimbriata CBS 114723]
MIRTSTSTLLRRTIARAGMPTTSTRAASTALSKPTLANIEKRWESMPMQEQAELWMSLRDRMKENWKDLTLQEKKAAYWIAFGPHGPRAEAPAGEKARVLTGTFIGIGISLVIFLAIRSFAKPGPESMSQQWQEAANEKLKSQNADPITGISSPGYTGKGQVQSPPRY